MIENTNGDIIIYQTDDGLTKIDVKIHNETVWLSQQQMADLYDTTKQNISSHIKNIFDEEELIENSTVKEFLTVRKEGNRNVSREIPFYNLDMIISLGYRIKSKVATNFRKWATERLKEYMIKGFTMDDERLKGNGAGSVSHNQAIEKAKTEYKKYQVKTISPVEKEYIESLKRLNSIKKKN